MDCGFQVDSDIYGIGICIGYYAQAFSLRFANYFVLGEAEYLGGINSTFVFALGIAGSIYAYDARNIYAIEVFLLLQSALTIGGASLLSNTRYSSRYLPRSGRTLLRKDVIVNAGLGF